MGPGEGGGAGGESVLPAGLCRHAGGPLKHATVWGRRCKISGLCFVLLCLFLTSLRAKA